MHTLTLRPLRQPHHQHPKHRCGQTNAEIQLSSSEPLLQRSEAPVIVNVSSGLGSETEVRDPERVESKVNALAYCSSKSALVMVTTQYAKAYPEIKINVVDPGYTATEFNGHSGPQTVTEGTDAMVAMACIGADGPTGTFTDRHGDVPW